MFTKRVVEEIARQNEHVLYSLRTINDALEKRFWEMRDPILALLLSVASREPLLLIGKPGTAKSGLIRAFCETVGLTNEGDLTMNGPLATQLMERDRKSDATGYFEYLLTPFTEPSELFGFYDIEPLVRSDRGGQNGKLQRIEKGMMQNAYVVYLDEVFNASSAILNSLLAFLNERVFHDRGERKHVLYEALFAATNQVPESGELAAVFDRFLLRCHVDNVRAEPMQVKSLLERGWADTVRHSAGERPHAGTTHGTGRTSSQRRNPQQHPSSLSYGDLFIELRQLRAAISTRATRDLVPSPLTGRPSQSSFYSQLLCKINTARTGGFSAMSNRRLIKMLYVMLIHCMYRSVNGLGGPEFELGDPEIGLMEKFFYDRVFEPLVWK